MALTLESLPNTFKGDAMQFPAKEADRLRAAVLEATNLNREDSERRNAESLVVPYASLIEGVLAPGEVLLLSGCHVPYTTVDLCYRDRLRDGQWPSGRLLLSSHRLIFVSFVVSKEAIVAAVERPPKLRLPTRFIIDGMHAERSYVYTIPLEAIRGLSFSSAKERSKLTEVRRFPFPDPCCACCCKPKTPEWHRTARELATYDEDWCLTFGALLPPWGDRTDINVHICKDTPAALLRDYMRTVHGLCPQLLRDPSGVRMIPEGVDLQHQAEQKEKNVTQSDVAKQKKNFANNF